MLAINSSPPPHRSIITPPFTTVHNGVGLPRVIGWRRGALPRDLALPKLYRVAQRVPGGIEALFPNIVDVLGDEK